MKFATKTIHAGIEPDPVSGAVMTPIYQTATYAQSAPGEHKGFEYGRTHNPTRNALQANLAALENGTHGICFSSGLAAMDAVLKLLKTGDEVVATNDIYGGSYRLITNVYGKFGIEGKFVPMYDADNIEQYLSDKTKLIWIETPTNPMLQIVDIEAVCKIAKEKGILTCVDNTFASPYLQTPLDLGADIVLHSATKYLGGHSDVVHGALVVKDEDLAEQFYYMQNASGAVPGPVDCFLVLRGIKTLHLRVERACQNAKIIAEALSNHPKIANVYFPGFENHPGHLIAKKQMRHFGAMVAFDLRGDSFTDAKKVLSNTRFFILAESLGGVESLIGHPASMTHASIPKQDRLKVGMTDSLIRLSIGIEDVEDLLDDINMALSEL